MKTQVTIVGFGTMGRAITEAIFKNDRQIKVFGISKNNSNTILAKKNINQSDFIILAVKPQNAEEAVKQIKTHFNKKTILVSIMTGVSIKKLIRFSGHQKIVRMMPNL